MAILGEKGLSGIVKRFLDLVFFGGIGLYISLPISLRWYFDVIYRISSENYYFLLGFMYLTGIFCLIIIFELRKIFKTLNRRNPFMMDNVKSLNRMAISAFIIAASYIIKIIFFNSFLTVIITMIFIIVGLFTVIFAEVFRQAIEVKEENDLTI
jgi:hypothetical protein